MERKRDGGGGEYRNVLGREASFLSFFPSPAFWPQQGDNSVLPKTGFKQVPNWDLKPRWEDDKPRFLQPVPRTRLLPRVLSVKIPAKWELSDKFKSFSLPVKWHLKKNWLATTFLFKGIAGLKFLIVPLECRGYRCALSHTGLWSAGDWTQCFMRARQTVYLLSYTPFLSRKFLILTLSSVILVGTVIISSKALFSK